MVDIGGLITRLSPLFEETVKQEYNLLFNSKSEARNLSANLVEIQKVLAEAESRRLTDPRVRDWLQRLQDVTYEIDDALDEWEAANFQIRNPEFGDDDDEDDAGCTWLKKVSSFLESVCLCFQLVHKHRDVALNIKGLNEKVELLAKETVKYSTLLPINSDPLNTKPKSTTSFSQFVVLKGQHDQKDKIIGRLLTCYGRKDRVIDELQTCEDLVVDVQVISLVGMAGIGKTTLAQLAFHDPRVQNSFKLRSWISLSHTHDEIRVTKSILQSLDVSYPEGADLQKLLELIQSSVRGKKFLLVIDNVWIEDDSFWRQLKGSLICGGALESIILVTSRNENVAKSMGSTLVIKVKCLSVSDCWLLFKEIAFGGRDNERESLESIGQRIAKKCDGLPLAAETLGRYLRSRYSKQLWEDILKKELWQLEKVAEALFAPFALSYNELPLALKHCFSYCGILRKVGPIIMLNVDVLIRLWMMQGYLISSEGTDEDMELKGLDYFEELAARSFFLDASEYKYKGCEMHSIVRDFAQYLIKTAGSTVEEIRNCLDFYDGLSGNQLVRLKSVRVLGVAGGENKEIPLEIGNLIHLRYLDLGQVTMKKLPLTICDLYNLHTLDLRHCRELSELPKRIHRLRNLRHLVLNDTLSLDRVPEGVGKLIHLRTLDEFKVGRGMSNLRYVADLNLRGSKLRYLADLNQIRGSMRMYIGDLNEEEDVEDAKKAKLGKKIYITDLILEFIGENVRLDVMEALQVPPNLQDLYLKSYKSTQLPRWINDTCLSNLRNLTLHCEKCLHMPPLGTLPFLEKLTICHWHSLERVGPEFLGIIDEGNVSSLPLFPKLRTLWFYECGLWEDWEDITSSSSNLSIMPCLQTLGIYDCPMLKTLPHFLPPVRDFRTNQFKLVIPSTISS